MTKRLGTPTLPMVVHVHQCHDGPLQGASLALSENDEASAWLDIGGRIGRYPLERHRLRWQTWKERRKRRARKA